MNHLVNKCQFIVVFPSCIKHDKRRINFVIESPPISNGIFYIGLYEWMDDDT